MPKSGNFSPAFLGSLTPATTGVNEQALINLLQLDLNETNLDDYGRFTNLIETVNEEKAQEYFQKKENVLYEGFELNIKIDEELRNFLLN